MNKILKAFNWSSNLRWKESSKKSKVTEVFYWLATAINVSNVVNNSKVKKDIPRGKIIFKAGL